MPMLSFMFNLFLHRENSDVLIWVENVFKLKMFLFCLNQVELAVFMYIVYLNKSTVSSVRCVYLKVVK